MRPNAELCRARHGHDRKRGALSRASARTTCYNHHSRSASLPKERGYLYVCPLFSTRSRRVLTIAVRSRDEKSRKGTLLFLFSRNSSINKVDALFSTAAISRRDSVGHTTILVLEMSRPCNDMPLIFSKGVLKTAASLRNMMP